MSDVCLPSAVLLAIRKNLFRRELKRMHSINHFHLNEIKTLHNGVSKKAQFKFFLYVEEWMGKKKKLKAGRCTFERCKHAMHTRRHKELLEMRIIHDVCKLSVVTSFPMHFVITVIQNNADKNFSPSFSTLDGFKVNLTTHKRGQTNFRVQVESARKFLVFSLRQLV